MTPTGYPKIFFVLSALGLVVIVGGSMANPLLPLYAQSLGASGVLVGLIISSFFIMRTFIELPSGYIADSAGRRIPIIIGITLTLIASLWCGLATNAPQLILARGLWGLGSSLFFCVTSTLIVDLFETERRGRALGTFQGIEFLGSLIGPLLGGYAALYLGFNMAFIVYAVALCPPLAISVVSKDLRRFNRSQLGLAKTSLRASISRLGSRGLALACFSGFVVFFVENGVNSTILPLYFNSQLGYDVSIIGLLMGIRSAGFILACFLTGPLSDRLGRRFFLLVSAALYASTFLLLTQMAGFEALMALMVLLGVANGIVQVTLPVLAAEAVDPSIRGTAIGLYRTSFDVGAVVGPIATTLILSSLGALPCFYTAALVMVANFALALAIRKV